LYPKILLALEGRKIISQHLRRRQAEYLNDIIEELHSGKTERSEYFVRINVTVAVMLIASFVFCTGGLVILGLTQDQIDFKIDFTTRASVASITLICLCLVSTTTAFRIKKRLFFILAALSDYDAYITAYEKEWGSGPPP
jgi:hypothetical protein